MFAYLPATHQIAAGRTARSRRQLLVALALEAAGTATDRAREAAYASLGEHTLDGLGEIENRYLTARAAARGSK